MGNNDLRIYLELFLSSCGYDENEANEIIKKIDSQILSRAYVKLKDSHTEEMFFKILKENPTELMPTIKDSCQDVLNEFFAGAYLSATDKELANFESFAKALKNRADE